jgi:hypothetical protein
LNGLFHDRFLCIGHVGRHLFSLFDYDNAVLTGLRDRLISGMQSMLNGSTIFICMVQNNENIMLQLGSLCWPRINQRINLKLVILLYHCLNGLARHFRHE